MPVTTRIRQDTPMRAGPAPNERSAGSRTSVMCPSQPELVFVKAVDIRAVRVLQAGEMRPLLSASG